MKRFRSLFSIAAAALALSASASAATLTYTINGGDGTVWLGGVEYTATSFSITATGDSSAVQSWLWEGTPAQITAVSAPFVQINTTSGTITTYLLSGSPGFLWNAVACSDGTTMGFHGFVATDSSSSYGSSFVVDAPNLTTDVTTPATYTGSINYGPSPLPTIDGTLEISTTTATISFTISAVPEPATATSSLLLSLGGLSLISRRNRKA